jgi:predicted PurR-regulated permease PerM
MLSAACFVVIVAGMKAAGAILVPFLLSIFIALIFSPVLFWMQGKGVRQGISILIILIAIILVAILLGRLVGGSINEFLGEQKGLQSKLAERSAPLIAWLESKGVDVTDENISELLNPGKAIQMAQNTLVALQGMIKLVFLILLTVVFILLEASGFPRKLQAAFGAEGDEALSGFTQFAASVKRYLAIKTIFSALTGILIWLWLTILGVDFAMVWGLLAFLLNYIPNIGSILAAVPAVLVALVLTGTGGALLTAAGFLVVNLVLGSIIEPRYMGRGLGLSTLVVFLSLVFWGWVLGPVGMLLSVPLTMVLRIGMASSETTRWISILLGSDTSGKAPSPVEP